MRIAVLTVYTDNLKPLADIVIPNLKSYCSKQDYTLYTFNITSTNIYFGYKKIEKLLSIIEEVDVVLCLDLDTLITNHNIKIERFLDSEHDFFICKDVNGLNAGSFIVKNTEWAIMFLGEIYSGKRTFECEQEVMELFKDAPGYKEKIKILPHPSINSLLYEEYAPTWGIIGNTDTSLPKPTHEEGDWRRGCFICHLPGMTLERRLEIFAKLQKDVIL